MEHLWEIFTQILSGGFLKYVFLRAAALFFFLKLTIMYNLGDIIIIYIYKYIYICFKSYIVEMCGTGCNSATKSLMSFKKKKTSSVASPK